MRAPDDLLAAVVGLRQHLRGSRFKLVELVHAQCRDLGKGGLVLDAAILKYDDFVAERDGAAMMADDDCRAPTGS